MPKVYVTRRVPEASVELLRSVAEVRQWDSDDVVPRSVLLQEVADCDGLFCLLTERIDDELLDRAPRLKVVANMAVGYDNIDVAAVTRRGIVATNTPGVLTETSADLAWALILATARRVVEGVDFVRAGKWKTWGPMLLLGHDVHHATLGVIGLGRIGFEVAKRSIGFDMKVLYHNRRRRPDVEQQYGWQYADLPTLLRESDIVTIHTDYNPSSHHLIGREQLQMMKRTAYLINTARGPIVDNMALAEALEQGWIAGAGLDVTDPEPIPLDHPLTKLPNCVILPHIASASVATRTRMATLAAENIVAVLQGKRPPTPINPEVLEGR
ncbi:MAG TPA: D-glycerate dehydrogenase [Chloroflexota bacterium]